MARDYLEECGMKFRMNPDGTYMCYQGCFSTKPRSHIVENHFKPVCAALGNRVNSYGIRCLDGITVTNLLIRDGVCCGAFAIDGDTLCCILAKAVVLAAGGASTIFSRNMYPDDISGDGYAMSARANARIANMEFVQIGLGLALPKVNLLGPQLWEALPQLTNGRHEHFLYKYAPENLTEDEIVAAKYHHFPFSSRDISKYVEIGVEREIQSGGATEHGNVYLDFLHTDFDALFQNPNSLLAPMWPLTYQRFQEMGIDLYKDKIEIACFAHAVNGGIKIDPTACSSIPGLYAARRGGRRSSRRRPPGREHDGHLSGIRPPRRSLCRGRGQAGFPPGSVRVLLRPGRGVPLGYRDVPGGRDERNDRRPAKGL